MALAPAAGVQGVPPDALISAGVAIVPGDLQGHLSCPWINYDAVIISRPHNFERAGDDRAHMPAERRPAVRLRGSVLAAPDTASETCH